MEITKIMIKIEMSRFNQLEAIERNFLDLIKANEDRYIEHIKMQEIRIKELREENIYLQRKNEDSAL